MHLVDKFGRLHAQRDQQPRHGQYPTTFWEKGEQIGDNYILELPNDLLQGEYYLIVSMYNAASGKRLPVYSADGRSYGDSIIITSIKILD